MQKTKEIEDEQLDQSVVELEEVLVRLGWVARRHLEQELDVFHITVPQFIALRCIRESSEGCSMSQLAESSYQVSPTMTGIVDRLVERGLVQRERDLADRRTLRVMLTPAGSDLLNQVREHQRSWMRHFLQELVPEARSEMIEMARRYLNLVESGL